MFVYALMILQISCFGVGSGSSLLDFTPNRYLLDEEMFIIASSVSSLKNALNYNYYDLPFCNNQKRPPKGGKLGESLSREASSIYKSPYDLQIHSTKMCQTLCRKVYQKKDLAKFRQIITDEYSVHWKLDELPVAVRTHDIEAGDYVVRGYPVGFRYKLVGRNGETQINHYLFNHVRITIRVNLQEEDYEDGYHIVGFEVLPMSIKHEYIEEDVEESEFDPEKAKLSTCNADVPAEESIDPKNWQSVSGNQEEVIFTYDVIWERSDTLWSHRWDIYMHADPHAEIHYFSLINSVLVVLSLSGVVAMILLQTLHKDISSYNSKRQKSDIESPGNEKETGWKFLYGDVFRPPKTSPGLLAALIGSGMQLLGMLSSFIVFSMLGLTSPNQRSLLFSTMLFLFVFMGSIAGYTSARVYKFFGGKHLMRSTLCTSLLYPGIMGSLFVAMNVLTSNLGSTLAVPLNVLFLLVVLWICVSTPLIFTGAYFGFSQPSISIPVKINLLRRQIPHASPVKTIFTTLLGGLMPYTAVYIELYFIMSAMWLDKLHLVFWFFFVVIFILIATCAEISILLCYYQLCSEDYEWQWRSFLSSGSSALYMFLHTCWYYHYQLEISGVVSSLLYFGYACMASISFFILTGSVGFLSCLYFNKLIYNSIKID